MVIVVMTVKVVGGRRVYCMQDMIGGNGVRKETSHRILLCPGFIIVRPTFHIGISFFKYST